jgi:hypothetical protein
MRTGVTEKAPASTGGGMQIAAKSSVQASLPGSTVVVVDFMARL